jgi:hypothetical protein
MLAALGGAAAHDPRPPERSAQTPAPTRPRALGHAANGAKTGERWQSVLTPTTMITKPATLADSDRDLDEDVHPSASARFRLKMNAFGDLVPEIVPIDEGKRPQKRGQDPR